MINTCEPYHNRHRERTWSGRVCPCHQSKRPQIPTRLFRFVSVSFRFRFGFVSVSFRFVSFRFRAKHNRHPYRESPLDGWMGTRLSCCASLGSVHRSEGKSKKLPLKVNSSARARLRLLSVTASVNHTEGLCYVVRAEVK